MKFIGTFIFCIFACSSAFATQKAELNAAVVTVENAFNEDVVIERTSRTPSSVALKLSPHVVHNSVCLEQKYEKQCGYDGAYCGSVVQRVCDNAGDCREYDYPNECCYMRESCARYGDAGDKVYEKIFLNFKKSLPVSESHSDVFDVTPLKDDKFDVAALSNGRPYEIKRKGNTFNFIQSRK